MQQLIIKTSEGVLVPPEFKRTWENCKQFWEKMLKFAILKSWRTIHWNLKFCGNVLLKPTARSLALEAEETLKRDNNSKILKNIAFIYKNYLNSCYLNLQKHSITFRIYAVTNYQILEEIILLLGLKKPKKWLNIFQKTANFIKKLIMIVISKSPKQTFLNTDIFQYFFN